MRNEGTTLTHAELVKRASYWLANTIKCHFALQEYSGGTDGEIPDAIGWVKRKDGNLYYQSYLVECKVTKADFVGDQEKSFRQNPALGMGNYRYYMCVPGVIEPDWLPDRWGLLYVYPSKIKLVKAAVYIGYPSVAQSEQRLLCSALRRVHIRGDLAKIYDRKTLDRKESR